MGLKQDGGGREGEGGRAKGEGGRGIQGGRGGKWCKGGKFEIFKNFAAPPQACVCWCDPQLGDEGRVLAINMRRIF